MSGLREAFDEIVADVPVYGDLDRAIEQAERERRRRYGVVAGLAAAAAVVALIVGVLAVTGDGDDSSQPIGPALTPTDGASDTTPQALNGRIQSTDDYLRRLGIPCDGCIGMTSTFRSDTGTLLVVDPGEDPSHGIAGIRVVDRDGLVADLRCPSDFACVRDAIDLPGLHLSYGLGPGPDEFYESTALEHRLRVWGFDGTPRPDLKLPPEVAYTAGADFAWSPDRSRLAVLVNDGSSGGVWLIESNGEAKLVYQSLEDEARPIEAFYGPSWSPDGGRLGWLEVHWNVTAEFWGGPKGALVSSKAVSLLLPDPDDDGRGEPTTLYDSTDVNWADPQYDAVPAIFLWSPDGTRVAIRDYADERVLELSAEDGTVLAEHPFLEGDLIWPERER